MQANSNMTIGARRATRWSVMTTAAIKRARAALLCGFTIGLLAACATPAPNSSSEVTLLFTNDFESAYAPVDAWWRDDLEQIGGIAYLATLVDDYRAREDTVFLFDAGDIFTGTLASLTEGEISFELMLSMDYDAMVIGNHEFEYGWEVLAHQKDRVSFPVLAANLYYRGTDIPFAQRYTILERDGVRLGVIGVMGQDAATALIPSNIAGLDVRDPATTIAPLVESLRPSVDLIVVLTHQGETAPMQTDDEALTSRDRGNDANVALASAVPGLDVVFAGHTDAGTPTALRDPVNGTLIMQTYGQGQHLGVLKLVREGDNWVESFSGLTPVDPSVLQPHAQVAQKLAAYEAAYSQIFEPVVALDRIARRDYYGESELGNLLADRLVAMTGAPIALMPSGALRKDLPAGEVALVDLQDMFPFRDRIADVLLSGQVLRQVVEQGVSLERGLLQVSGLEVHVDYSAPRGQRVTQLQAAGVPVRDEQMYEVATIEILAQGGDQYTAFLKAESVALSEDQFIDRLIADFGNQKKLRVPGVGRFIERGRSAHD